MCVGGATRRECKSNPTATLPTASAVKSGAAPVTPWTCQGPPVAVSVQCCILQFTQTTVEQFFGGCSRWRQNTEEILNTLLFATRACGETLRQISAKSLDKCSRKHLLSDVRASAAKFGEHSPRTLATFSQFVAQSWPEFHEGRPESAKCWRDLEADARTSPQN